MPKDDRGLPPPAKGGKTSPDMAPDDASVYNRLQQLAGRGSGMNDMEGMGGMGGEEQSAQLVTEGAQLLIQAARMNPRLQAIIMPLMQQLQSGIQQLAGAGGGEDMSGMGMEEGGSPKPKKKRQRPPSTEEESYAPY